jgi:transcription elongation factor GreA
VTVRDLEFDETETYVIVGSAEANPAEGRISNESPMGRALMGGQVGQRKPINTPGGAITVEIVEIE